MSSRQNDSRVIKKELENGCRLNLLREKLEDVLRTKFDNHLPVDPGELYALLNNHQERLITLQKKGKISKKQFDLLFPQNARTDSKKFDFTLLLTLLHEVCGYKLSNPKWRPDDDDHSDLANFVRLRDVRNKMAHCGSAVSKKEFDETLDSAKQPMLELGFPLQIQEILTINLDNEAQRQIDEMDKSRKEFSYKFIRPVGNFIGREKELDYLHECLDKLNTNSEKYGVVIRGMPGVGKTQMVRKYWTEHSTKYYDNRIIWIDGQSEKSIQSEFIEIAKQAGLPVQDSHNQLKPIKQIVDMTYRHFAMRKPDENQRKILFVFDNINKCDHIEQFLPYLNMEPFMIITSQIQHWDETRFETIDLKIFEVEMAKQFLVNNLDSNQRNNKDLEMELLSLLGFHPLALQQAVSYIKINHINVQEYLSLLKTFEWNRIADKFPGNGLEQRSVFKTFYLSLKNILDEQSEIAVKVMRQLSYLDGNNIDKDIIKQLCNGDVIDTDDAITILHNYSLINRQYKTITMHSLMQLTVKSTIPEEKIEEILNELMAVIFAHFSADKARKERGSLTLHHLFYMYDQEETRSKIVSNVIEKNIIGLKEFFILKDISKDDD